MSSKVKSTLPENPNKKASPVTPSRVSKISRGVAKSDSSSPLQTSRLSVDRSPRSVSSKSTPEGARPSTKTLADRRSPKLSTPPEQTRALKGSDLQVQLKLLQEDLKKAQDQLAVLEKEKEQAIDKLKEAQKLAEEANEKLNEALVAQKRAEETSEIEKFRALEMEQAGIAVTQKKEEEWEKELEDVRNQHALDVSTLLSANQELAKLKQELQMTCDAKNQALNHADDATKLAEVNAEKVEALSDELARLKALLDSKVEFKANEDNKVVSELKSEIDSLRTELERVKILEEKLMEREACIEELNVKVEAAKMAEAYAHNLVEEWKQRVEELENQMGEANRLERAAAESLGSVMKELEGTDSLLKESETEIAALKEKVGLLEITLERERVDLEEADRRANTADKEANEMAKTVESLQLKIESVKEEKVQALNNEKLAASSVETLLEEKNKLINELESSKDEEEKSKKAMESLVAALHEVSLEAREAKEKFLSIQAEHKSYTARVEDLECVLKETNQKYEALLDNAKHEIDILTNACDYSKHELEESIAEWEQKELHLTNQVKQLEEEKASMETKTNGLVNSLKEVEEEARVSNEEVTQLKDTLKEAESEVIYFKDLVAEAKAESMKLKESLLDKENELQCLIQESEEIRSREAVSQTKIEELTKLLEEQKAMAYKKNEENGELTDSEKDYDLLPKVVEFSEENGNGKIPKVVEFSEENGKVDEPTKHIPHEKTDDLTDNEVIKTGTALFENGNGKQKENETKEKEEEVVESEFKMWESCKIDEKDYSTERETEHESFEEETNSKAEGGESFEQTDISSENLGNGSISPTKLNPQKKKKPLLRKFGSLLKKRGTTNPK